MIRYKCDSCGIELETDDSLSGKHEACPGCQNVNLVPLSKRDLKAGQAMRDVKAQGATKQKQGRPSGQAERKGLQPHAEASQDAKLPQPHVHKKAADPYSELRGLSSFVILLGAVAGIIGFFSFIVAVKPDSPSPLSDPTSLLRLVLWLGAGLQLVVSGFILRGLYYIAVNTAKYVRATGLEIAPNRDKGAGQ